MKRISPTTASAGALAAVLVALAGCSAPAEDAPLDSLVIGVTAFSVDYDVTHGTTYSTNGSGLNKQAVYESLIFRNQSDDTFEPWLATDWEIASDRLSMTMTLRDDVVFTDGERMTAPGVQKFWDVGETLDDFLWKGPNYAVYGATVTATDEYELEFTTTTPIDHVFFTRLAQSAMVSPAALDDLDSLAEKPVGSGPYLIDETIPEVSISFVRNPEYRDPEAYPFDKLELKVFADNVAALNALKTGQIDATALDIPNAVEAEASGFAVHTGSGVSRVLFIQDRVGAIVPALGDVRVRQAMNMAFDREGILENLDLGYGYVSSQAYTRGQPGYLEGRDDEYPYDPERAKELLAEAGYPDGFDLTIPTTQMLAAFDPVVQQSLGDIGIRVTFEVLEIGDYITQARSGTWPVIMWAESFAATSSGSSFFKVGAFWNGSDFADPVVERLTRDAYDPRSDHREESVRAAQELAEYVLEEAWLVPFSRPYTVWGSIPEVEIEVSSTIYMDQLIWFQKAE